jgi:hypothetical protein
LGGHSEDGLATAAVQTGALAALNVTVVLQLDAWFRLSVAVSVTLTVCDA